MANYPAWQIDDCPDARGFLTIRIADSGPHGRTDLDPVATAYSDRNAALIAEAPAMLAALRKAADALEGDIFTDADECGASVANARAVHGELRAILSRIDGAAPAPTAPAPVSAPGFAAHALDTLKDCEAWLANGGDVDGVFFDDATMLDRVRESLALATPTAQPAGDTCQACGRASLDCSRAPCPTVVAERGEG